MSRGVSRWARCRAENRVIAMGRDVAQKITMWRHLACSIAIYTLRSITSQRDNMICFQICTRIFVCSCAGTVGVHERAFPFIIFMFLVYPNLFAASKLLVDR